MRHTLLLALLVLLTACGREPVPPAASLQFHDGQSRTLASYRGQWVVINYWAVWCKPCLKEIPHFNRLAAEYASQVVVLGVDYDDSQGSVLDERIARMDIRFPTLARDPASSLGHARPTVLPTTVIYGPDGTLQHTLLGDQNWASLAQALGLGLE